MQLRGERLLPQPREHWTTVSGLSRFLRDCFRGPQLGWQESGESPFKPELSGWESQGEGQDVGLSL